MELLALFYDHTTRCLIIIINKVTSTIKLGFKHNYIVTLDIEKIITFKHQCNIVICFRNTHTNLRCDSPMYEYK